MSTRPLTRWWNNTSETMAKYRADDDARRLHKIILELEAIVELPEVKSGELLSSYIALSAEEAREVRHRLWCRGWRTTLDRDGLTILFTGERHQDTEPPGDLKPPTTQES